MISSGELCRHSVSASSSQPLSLGRVQVGVTPSNGGGVQELDKVGASAIGVVVFMLASVGLRLWRLR